ncbi:MAG: hypothetical protein OEU36_25785, partial [Gammaproteobacteria bacterium]|nr:hypothetical protein [Gammaproteobacteria bacterium]
MKDRYCEKGWFSVRLFGRAIPTCILIAQIMIPQTASGEAQNIFYPGKITVTAGNNAIREIPDNVVWYLGLKEGDCEPIEERTDKDVYPISAPSAASFRLEVQMHTCQGLRINYLEGMLLRWEIEENEMAGVRSFAKKPGSTDSIWYVDLPTPKAVGVYTLILELEMVCCDNAPNYTLTRKLFVTKHPNQSSTTSLSTIGIPKREWYEKAVSWAQGGEGEDEVLEKLLKEVYSYGSKWLYDGEAKCREENGSLGNQDITWDKLIDNSDPCKNGDCRQFSRVFESLARVLGIDGMHNETTIGQGGINVNPKTGKQSPWPFVTVPGIVSLDPDFAGNTRLRTAGSPFDRYTFAT